MSAQGDFIIIKFLIFKFLVVKICDFTPPVCRPRVPCGVSNNRVCCGLVYSLSKIEYYFLIESERKIKTSITISGCFPVIIRLYTIYCPSVLLYLNPRHEKSNQH